MANMTQLCSKFRNTTKMGMVSMVASRGRTWKIAYDGLMIAFAMIVSYVETLIPVYLGAPGVKPGFANFFVVFLLSGKHYADAVIVNGCRILLTGFMFGNLFSIAYSLSGAVCSFMVMLLLSRIKWMSLINVSVFGGMFHNIGQFLAACVLLKGTDLTYYLPVLLLAGVVTGTVNGVLVKTITPYLRRLENR